MSALTVALIAAAASSANGQAYLSVRGTANEKGSVLWFSRVSVGWDAAGNIVQDTFIELTNDFPEDVHVQMYYVNGDEPLEQGSDNRPHEGWNWLDNLILLTGDEPAYWSLATGHPKGTAPFGQLDAGNPPGRPDPYHPGRWVVRGFIVLWAVDSEGAEINWNHLSGKATLVDYMDGSAWEYTPWSFQARTSRRGQETDGNPGILLFNGGEFDLAPGTLLMNFPAVGSTLRSANRMASVNDVELTLQPMMVDFRNVGFDRLFTKVRITVWNMNEVKLTGIVRPLTCWESERLGHYGFPNHFLLQNLQTDRGKAHLDSLGSTECATVSLPAPLLGLVSQLIHFSPKTREEAGVELAGLGCEEGALLYDVEPSIPPERVDAPNTDGKPTERRTGDRGAGRTAAN
ncbi:MAG: hypothetical protein J5J06_09735 [Phycisphaerae bacterium]|nr:hypothetical protein [Phycisphaerae bacterium]